MKFSSGHLAHAVFDCDFHYIETPTNTLDAGNRDAFYGGHTRYSVSMTDGKSFTVFNGSWDEDCVSTASWTVPATGWTRACT